MSQTKAGHFRQNKDGMEPILNQSKLGTDESGNYFGKQVLKTAEAQHGRRLETGSQNQNLKESHGILNLCDAQSLNGSVKHRVRSGYAVNVAWGIVNKPHLLQERPGVNLDLKLILTGPQA
ncbi:uncharacterized protein ACIGJ3_016804 isoform 1-T1 [Trichechus inunguis]